MGENNRRAWVGANDIDQAFDFVWMDGSPMIFTDFGEGEPNNVNGTEHCLEVTVQFINFILGLYIKSFCFITVIWSFFKLPDATI